MLKEDNLKKIKTGITLCNKHPQCIKATDLLENNQVKLCHNGQEYRLTLTKNNKLILTK